MKIENSNVSMSAVREYSTFSYSSQKLSLSISDNSQKQLSSFQNYLDQPLKTSVVCSNQASQTKNISLVMLLLHRIFDVLAGRGTLDNNDIRSIQTGNMLDLRSDTTGDPVGNGTVWTQTISTTQYFEEKEATAFSSTGYATTSDGRTIPFDIEVSLSRSFMSEYSSLETSEYIFTDPLMIDVGDNGPSVTDMKFLFDLDQDGRKEEISFAGKGNGFLALDLNGDGIINDGGELFGTKSGDGFADLAKYDEDGNGWIDENDSVFSRLKVWTKDENGRDKLLDLKASDVGAIYLGHTKTDFSLTDANNHVNALIRSTGIFLHESGSVGTIRQLDLTS